ncbi:hypothetical protein THMIRHAS_05600 [Thiosulfatimonas sediminis]|uniref:Uncharacterized protein n=1 Tax=Thiosulfatimonas sediminis TaxID=2675054 RepID=A0A6F8PT25_9GAMM|nr:hypothetical protein [Thiosulfatimonas sediminis]BBP45187.1 hypothetical protein THMIRHAS_05600 [Thiosulfatimonas sediminis]
MEEPSLPCEDDYALLEPSAIVWCAYRSALISTLLMAGDTDRYPMPLHQRFAWFGALCLSGTNPQQNFNGIPNLRTASRCAEFAARTVQSTVLAQAVTAVANTVERAASERAAMRAFSRADVRAHAQAAVYALHALVDAGETACPQLNKSLRQQLANDFVLAQQYGALVWEKASAVCEWDMLGEVLSEQAQQLALQLQAQGLDFLAVDIFRLVNGVALSKARLENYASVFKLKVGLRNDAQMLRERFGIEGKGVLRIA